MTAASDELPGERRSGYGVLLQMVQQNDDKHEEGHRRLRVDYRDLDGRLAVLEAAHNEMTAHILRMEAAPQPSLDVLKLTFSPRVVVFIIGVFLSAWVGVWASTYGLRTDVAGIITRMNAREQIEASRAQIQDERANTLRDSLEAMKRRQELQQYEIQGLKEMILKRGKS